MKAGWRTIWGGLGEGKVKVGVTAGGKMRKGPQDKRRAGGPGERRLGNQVIERKGMGCGREGRVCRR